MTSLPSYDQLPVDPAKPKGSSWGVWGDDDVFGCLNLLTEERVFRLPIAQPGESAVEGAGYTNRTGAVNYLYAIHATNVGSGPALDIEASMTLPGPIFFVLSNRADGENRLPRIDAEDAERPAFKRFT